MLNRQVDNMNSTNNCTQIKMAQGLFGFETVQEYQLTPVPGHPLFDWLEGIGDDAPGFLLLNQPNAFFPKYQVEIERSELVKIAAVAEDVRIYNMITVPDNPRKMTANLLAPILINCRSGEAKQIVLHDSAYTTKHQLFADEQQSEAR
jgi:flagellar assembly factor FliW